LKSLGNWAINNQVTVNLVMIGIIIAGIFTVFHMRREMFPQYSVDILSVDVAYPGSSPSEVEEGICVKIEEKLKGIEGIDRIFSSSAEGWGSVWVELNTGADTQYVLDEINREVDSIDTFPDDAKTPIVQEIVHRMPVVTIAVFGDVSERILHEMAEKIRDDLISTGKVTVAKLTGVRDYEIFVEVSEENLRRYGISFDHVVKALKTGSIDLSGGTIKTKQGEILIRSKGQLYTGREFANLPLITLKDGTVIRIGQVAQVIDGFKDVDIKTRFNGKPAALVRANRTSQEDVIEISKAVQEYVQKQRQNMPEGVQIATWYNIASLVQDRIDLLMRNGLQGIVLVFLMLTLFLNFNLAVWVSVGIPVSFMGAFLILDFSGETINMISLFAFIMTLGILVDDAIIVGENIYTHFENGKSPSESVVEGLNDVGKPVIMAIATTVIAFAPLIFIAGILGKFIAVMPRAVIAILVVSLGEALIILPAHLKHALLSSSNNKNIAFLSWHNRISSKLDQLLNLTIKRYYTPAINYVVQNKYFTFSMGIGVLIICLGIIAGGYVQFLFFPKGDSNWIIAEVGYPLGTAFENTEKTVKYIEQKAFQLNDFYNKLPTQYDKLVVNTFSLVGGIQRKDWNPGEFGGHCGEIWIELLSSENRPDISVHEILAKWRSLVGEIPGIDRLSFIVMEGGGPAGKPIEIQLSGSDFNKLRKAADDLKAEMATFPGVFDITDNFKIGKQERQVKIKKGARSLGITMVDIAKQIRQAFYGEDALKIQRGRDEVTVRVRYSDYERRAISGIEEMRIRTNKGDEIPIEEVADIISGRSYAVIHRADRKRIITVSSDVNEQTGNASRIVNTLKSSFLPNLTKHYPGINYKLEGQEKRSRESLDSLKKGYLLALIGIFIILASQFNSSLQPLIIMAAIPFGLIGAVFGHLLLGMKITMISIFGFVALSGIVVNDSLILIDFINKAIIKGMEINTAVIESGKARFRAVLLTSVTTIAGLLPLLLERSFQAQFLVPMAVSICFGLFFATILTLLYVPSIYLILNDMKIFVKNMSVKIKDKKYYGTK